MKPARRIIVAVAVAGIAFPLPAFAQSGTWNTVTTPSSWTTAGNWLDGVIASGSGNTAHFNQVNITADTTVNLDAARTIGNLIFGDTTPSHTWILATGSAGSTLALAGAAPTITVNNSQATISAVLAGSSGFTKTGAGNLRLEGTNTISGSVTLSAGSIQLVGKPLANATSVALNGGTLILGGNLANSIGGTISFGGGTWQFNQPPATDYSSQFSTAANQEYKFLTGNPVTFASNLSSAGGNLTKDGSSSLTLSAANTFSGTTRSVDGNLILSHALALQNSTIDATNSNAGGAARGLVLSGVTTPTFGGLTGTKALATLFNTSTGGYGSLTSVTLNPGTGVTRSYAAAIADGAAGMKLIKTGSGTQVLTASSSYTGGTDLTAGILSIGHAAALGTTGTISFGGGTLQYSGITTDLSSRFSTAPSQAYSVDTNGQNVTWASGLASSGGTLTKSGAGTLTLSGGTASTSNGAIAVNAGRLASLNSASLQNMTGTITVASGATFDARANFGASIANNFVLSGTGSGIDGHGALNIRENANLTGAITLAAHTRITHDWNIATISGSITGTNTNLELTTLQASQFGFSISAPISLGTGALTLNGIGTVGSPDLTLSGSNTFTGGLVIQNGVVQLNGASALNSTAGQENAVTFGASTTTGRLALNGRSYVISNLASNATPGSPVVENNNATAVTLTVGNSQNLSGTYAGVIRNGTAAGALSLTKQGTGALTLSAANTYTGVTTISAGRLALGANGSFVNSPTIIVGGSGSSGAVLDLTAKTGAFTIGAGQTLSGGGTVQLASSGTLNVLGTFAPGNSPGLFTYEAGTTVLTGTTVMEIFGTSRATGPSHGAGFYDAVDVTGGGTLQLGGLLTLSFDQVFNDNTSFNLFSPFGGSTLIGSPSGVNVIGSFYTGLTWNPTASGWKSSNTASGQSLEFSAASGTLVIVPEPGALALAGLGIGLAGWLARRRTDPRVSGSTCAVAPPAGR